MRPSAPALLILGVVVVLYFNTPVQAQQLAFPTAEGYGRFARGGRGGDVYIVTNLCDSGPGSLRDVVNSANGSRTIVFEVSGTIELRSDLIINKPFITIAGQTTRGYGITLKDRTFVLENTHDIIVRYIRIRYGDQNKTSADLGDPDAIRTNGISNVIFDHIADAWGIDAIHDLRGEKFTLQWSMYGECLNKSIHKKGEHAMLASFRDLTDNISVHHNLFFSSRNRHPTLGGGKKTETVCVVDFRNNVIFNRTGATNFGNCKMNVINNFYRPGSL
jgi:pectinesterase